jgi:hypothetical protein
VTPSVLRSPYVVRHRSEGPGFAVQSGSLHVLVVVLDPSEKFSRAYQLMLRVVIRNWSDWNVAGSTSVSVTLPAPSR